MSGPYDADAFKVGDRVEIAPCTDTWMRGARFGDVVEVKTHNGRIAILCVRMDKLRKVLKLSPSLFTRIEGAR